MLTAASLTVLLSLTALIPRESIRSNLSASAEFLCGSDMFAEVWEGTDASRIDHYADCVLLGIAWQYDDSAPLTSVMESSYYHNEDKGEAINLRDAVTSDLSANKEYLRYWHGSILLVRPLLTIMTIRGIYVLFAVILALLLLILLFFLIRSGDILSAAGLMLGMVLTFSWFVPFCLEYIWVYLIMLGASVAVVLMKDDVRPLIVTLMVCGILTAFMDFLTAETLTLTIPLLLGINKLRRSGTSERDLIKGTACSAIGWVAGYGGMMGLKWILASIVLGINSLEYVTGNLAERTNGLVLSENYFSFFGPIKANTGCMIPFCFGTAGIILGIIVLLGCIYSGYVYRRGTAIRAAVIIYALTGLIPFVRFMVIRNHSVLHYFFTFRALMAFVLAVILIMGELLRKKG